MSDIKLQYKQNPNHFDWNDIIDAAYHNLGERAGRAIVHLALPIKNAMSYRSARTLDYKMGLLDDKALLLDLLSAYPEEDHEYLLIEMVFLRAFLFDEEVPEAIFEWSCEHFYPDAADYIWINGKLRGGLCYPQSKDPDDYPPLKETLSDFVIYRS